MKLNFSKGFTLIETLISILLLSIVLASGAGFYTNSTRVMMLATNKRIALEMGIQAMEQIKNSGYAVLPNCTTNPSQCGVWVDVPLTGWVTSNTFPSIPTPPSRQRRITDEASSGTNANKKIEIKISWVETGNATPREISLVTYMAP